LPFGGTDDGPPASHPITQRGVFDEALTAERTARTYAEAMPQPCALAGRSVRETQPVGVFLVAGSRANCQLFDVPSGTPERGALHDDVLAAALPTIGLLVPDLCNDGHDCAWPVADDWLHKGCRS